MAKKVVIEPEDFNKIVEYVVGQPVKFDQAAKAAELHEIFKRALSVEIEFKETEKTE